MSLALSPDEHAEEALSPAVAEICGPDGRVGGTGVLVTPHLVLTCAHVVRDALGLPDGAEVLPEGDRPPGPREGGDDGGRPAARGAGGPASGLRVRFPLVAGAEPAGYEARLTHWTPESDGVSSDLAVLTLARAPERARPAPTAARDLLNGHPATVFGLPGDAARGGWHEGVLRGAVGAGWVQMSRADGQTDPIRPGFSGGPVWDKTLGAVVGVVRVTSEVRREQTFVIPVRRFLDAFPDLAPLLAPASPFRGLQPFGEEDAEHFFGRAGEVAELTRLVTAGTSAVRCVTVTGVSGAGKSSLVLAGVVPRLRAQHWEVLTLRVEGGGLRLEALRDTLERTDRGHGARRRLAVVVDQAESLLDGPEEHLRQAVDLLLTERPGLDVRVLVTIRLDHVERALRTEQFARLLAGGTPTFVLAPMERAQLHEAVTGPLRRIPGVDYEAGLVELLVDDTAGRPGGLPLLEYVLTRLWEHRDETGRLRVDAYRRLGRVAEALGREADLAWHDIVDDRHREAGQRLLRDLVRFPSEAATPLRARLSRRDADDGRWELAVALAGRRILVLGHDDETGEYAELAHEALIDHWTPLAEQVAEDRAFLSWRSELRQDRARWEREGRPASRLPAGAELERAERWLGERRGDLSDDDREFIEQGVRARTHAEAEAARRRRRDAWFKRLWVLVTVMAVLGTAVFAQQYLQIREEQRNTAAEQLVEQAGRLDDVSLTTSALFTVAAHRNTERAETRSAALAQYLRLRDVERVVTENHGEARQLAMSADGSLLYGVLQRGDLVRIDLAKKPRELPRRVIDREDSELVAVSPDGRLLARASDWGIVSMGVKKAPHVHGGARTVQLRKVEHVRNNARTPTDLRFDATGERILAAVPHEGVLVWETRKGKRVGETLTPPRGWDTAQAWFGADDTVVARIVPQDAGADAANGRLVSWRLSDARRGAPWGDRQTVAAAVSGNGSTLVTCTAQGALEAWSLGAEPRRLNSWGGAGSLGMCPLSVPRLDHSGRYLVGMLNARWGDRLGRYRFYVLDLQTAYPATFDMPAPSAQDSVMTGAQALPAVALGADRDGLRVAVAAGGSVATARVRPPTEFDSNAILGRARAVDADHARVATVAPRGDALYLWDLDSHQALAQARTSRELAAYPPVFSPDGNRLLTLATDMQTVLVWRLKNASGTPELTEEHRLTLPAPPGVTANGPDKVTGQSPAWIGIDFTDADHAVFSGLSYVSRWNLPSGKEVGQTYRPSEQDRLMLVNAAVSTFALARPGTDQALVRTRDRILLWDFGTGEQTTWIPRNAKKDTGIVRQIRLSPDGKRLAVRYSSGELRMWNVEDKDWEPHLSHDGVYWLGYFLNDDVLHTTADNGEQVVWDLSTRRELYRYRVAHGAVVDPDAEGSHLALLDGSDARLIPLDPKAWLDRMCSLAERELSDGERDLAPPAADLDDLC